MQLISWRLGLILAAFAATSAVAQQAGPRDNAAVGLLLEKYGTISAAYMMDDRCAHLDYESRLEFDYHTQQLHELLKRAAGAALLGAIQKGAIKAAQEYECGEKTKGFAHVMSALARDAYFQITHVPYGGDVKALAEANRLLTFMAHRKLDDRCQFLPAEERAEYDRHLDELTYLFAERAGEDRAAKVRAEEASAALSPQQICEESFRERLVLMLKRIRRVATPPK
jgi:hypothetical protein